MLPRGLLKEYFQILSLILRGFDILSIILAGIFAYIFKFGDCDLNAHYVAVLCIAGFVTTVVFPFFQLYESVRVRGFWSYIYRVIQAVGSVMLVLAGLAFLTKTGEQFSREWYMWWALFSFVLVLACRCSILVLLRIMRSYGLNERRIVVIGAGDLGKRLIGTVQQALWTGFRIVAIFDDFPKVNEIHGIPVLKTPADLSAYVAANKKTIDEIWLALPLRAEERVKKILHALRHDTITTRYILDIFGLDLFNHSMSDLAGFPALNINSSPMVGINRLIKALEDRIFAALILLMISPLLLTIAIGVKLSSKGPVFFKQLRHGWDGHIIKVYKFRTMYMHKEEENKVTQARANDKRITPFGRFLRRTSLDELPQFINVLQGRMSIVGPRPHAISHNEFYKDSIKAYMQRHKVKPGITGWAQVNGWRGETEQLEKMQKRVEYDLYYIENWSLIFDLKIIFLTVFQGFVHKNAY